jgi:hypothetical protein
MVNRYSNFLKYSQENEKSDNSSGKCDSRQDNFKYYKERPLQKERSSIDFKFKKPRSASRKPRSASRKPRSASRKPRSASRKPRSASRKPRSASRKPRSASRKPRSASRKPRSAPRKPRSASRKPRSAPRKPRSASRKPRNVYVKTQKYKEAPYKGKKWIILNVDKDLYKNIEKVKWDTKYKYNIIDKGINLKKINPLFKDKFIRTKNLIKTFEGFIDEFINNKDYKWTERQLIYLEDFRKDIRELRKDDLVYLYSVYYYNNDNKSIIDFIATNEDGSICYIRSTDLDGYNKVIINGIQLNLLSWFTMTKKDKLKLF